MATKVWEVTKVRYCDTVARKVAFEAQVIYPTDYLPDPPRVVAHRCSNALECNALDKPACAWSGTSPDREPFDS